VHHALEQLFRKMLEHPDKEFPSLDVLIDDFKWYMKRNADSFTEKDFDLKMELGKQILPGYYEKYRPTWNKVVVAEKAFRNIEVRGVPINGKIDKIEFSGTDASLIDYKTGSYDNAKPKFKRPDPEADPVKKKFEDEYGGDYWRQAVFYKILMENDRTHNWNMVSAEFDFVEPRDKDGKYYKEKVNVSKEDQDIVIQQIVDSYNRIMKLEFDGCGKEDCNWCNFARNHYRSPDNKNLPEEEAET